MSGVSTAIGVTTLFVALFNRNGAAFDPWFGVVLGGFFVSLLSSVGLAVCQLNVQRQSSLLRGEGMLARWTVSPAEWEQFRANDKARVPARSNAVKVRKESERDGVEVVIARDALQVDNDFYRLGEIEGLQWLPEAPPCLEYNMVTRSRNGSVHWNIRFPMAAGNDGAARAVWDAVKGAMPVVDPVKNRARQLVLRRAGIVSAIAGQVMLVVGLALYNQKEVQGVVLACFIFGAIATPAGVVVAAMMHWMLRRAENS